MSKCTLYDPLTWLSYARNQLAHAITAEMESHSESCTECRSRMVFSRKIASVVDLNVEPPPESWTSEAAAQFQLVARNQETSNIVGDLITDSYLHDEGVVRSGGTESRHLVFDLHKFEARLSLEYSGRRLSTVTGHVASKHGDLAVAFVAELRVAERTYSAKSNPFGEFSFSIDVPAGDEPLELRFIFEEEPCAIVLIPC
jgi:hypothetical protein